MAFQPRRFVVNRSPQRAKKFAVTGVKDLGLLRSRVGMVFQRPAPFPMSIYQNVAFGIGLHRELTRAEMDVEVESALRRAALWNEVKDELSKQGPELSGGQ